MIRDGRILGQALKEIITNTEPGTLGNFCDRTHDEGADEVDTLREHYAAHLRAVNTAAKAALASLAPPPEMPAQADSGAKVLPSGDICPWCKQHAPVRDVHDCPNAKQMHEDARKMSYEHTHRSR